MFICLCAVAAEQAQPRRLAMRTAVRRTRVPIVLLTAFGLVFTMAPPASAYGGGINSKAGWQTSRNYIRTGETFTVTESGSWTVDYRNFRYVGGEGYPWDEDARIWQGCHYDQGVPYGYLLARLGDGPTIRVGAGGTFTAPNNGDLQFRINDGDQCLGDNEGVIWVNGVP
jgi:hypothetical protein